MVAYDTSSNSKYAAISAFIFLRWVWTNIKFGFHLTHGEKLHFSCCGLTGHDRYWNITYINEATIMNDNEATTITNDTTSSSYIVFTSFLLLYVSTTTSTNTTVTGAQNDGQGLKTQMRLEPQVCFF